MHYALHAKFCGSNPVIVAFAFASQTEIENHISSKLQRASRNIPHHFFDQLMSRFVLRMYEIQSEIMAK